MKKLKIALMSVWAMITSWFLAFPADLYGVWRAMPEDIKAAIGPDAVRIIGIILIVAAAFKTIASLKKDNKHLKEKVSEMEVKDESHN